MAIIIVGVMIVIAGNGMPDLPKKVVLYNKSREPKILTNWSLPAGIA